MLRLGHGMGVVGDNMGCAFCTVPEACLDKLEPMNCNKVTYLDQHECSFQAENHFSGDNTVPLGAVLP